MLHVGAGRRQLLHGAGREEGMRQAARSPGVTTTFLLACCFGMLCTVAKGVDKDVLLSQRAVSTWRATWPLALGRRGTYAAVPDLRLPGRAACFCYTAILSSLCSWPVL
jgi:hypothetical protein